MAYSVALPTVRVSRGEPVTVMDSEKLTKNVGVSAGLYVALAGAVTDEIVGAVRSIVIGVVVKALDAGPLVEVTVPYTELAITWGINVPSLHEETVSVNDVPDAPLIENMQPVAVPALEKSPLATLFTF